MLSYLIRFFVHIGKIRLASIAESYLLINTFQKPPRMSPDVIRTNYLSLSPYPNAMLTSLASGNNLLVWFSAARNGSAICIPEAFLLYRALLARGGHDRIALFGTDPSVLIVIRDRQLVAQSTLSTERESFLEKLKREHAIGTVERYTRQEYENILVAGYSHLTFNDYKHLFSLDLPDIATFKTTLENLSTPLSILVLMALGFHYGLNYYLTQKLEESRQAYTQGRGAMIPIKHRLDIIAKENTKWDTFIADTLVRPDALHAALSILRAARDTNTTVKYIKVSAGKAETVVETQSATRFLKAIVKTGRFENVKLEFSKTDPLRKIDNAKIITQTIPYDVNGTIHEH